MPAVPDHQRKLNAHHQDHYQSYAEVAENRFTQSFGSGKGQSHHSQTGRNAAQLGEHQISDAQSRAVRVHDPLLIQTCRIYKHIKQGGDPHQGKPQHKNCRLYTEQCRGSKRQQMINRHSTGKKLAVIIQIDVYGQQDADHHVHQKKDKGQILILAE
ncbi:hypothetical protein D3C74_343450 [compost metagenome]